MSPPSQHFFDFWRARVDFVERLDPTNDFYEQNVLVWAMLDALAKSWASASRRPKVPERRCFGDFLEQFGGESFGRVCVPTLWTLGDQLGEDADPGARERVRQYGGRRKPRGILEERQARLLTDDPPVVDVRTELADVLSRVVRHRTQLRVEDLVLQARFGEIAYVQMRCPIIHEGRLGEGAHAFDFGRESHAGPTYLSSVFATPPCIGFAPSFMANTIRRCIDGYEAEMQPET